MTMRSWVRNLFTRPATRTIRKVPRRTRLALEALEDRWCPSTITVLNIGDAPGALTPTGTDTYTAPTLRAAIDGANAMVGADTINFDTSGVFSTAQTITLGGTQLELTDTTGATTITGPGVTVNGGGASRVFEVDSLVTASISGLTISGGNGIGQSATSVNDGSGGGLTNSGTATLTNCTFSGNHASGAGGGGLVNTGSATATLTDCTFSNNSSTTQGGGLEGGGLTLTGCIFTGNTAGGGGGMTIRGAATLIGCTFTSNSAGGGGGVNDLSSLPLTLTGCTFTGNHATNGSGGGLQDRTPLTMTDCIFTGNTATNNGGGAALTFSFTLTDCTFTGNTAVNGSGGGLSISIGLTATLTNCTVTGNTAVNGSGGGLSISIGLTATLTNCTVTGNTAGGNGGGMTIANQPGTVTLTNCTVSGNTAIGSTSSSGGGVFNSGTATLTDCTVSGNTAGSRNFGSGSGGGVFNGGTATLTNCTVSGNAAKGGPTGYAHGGGVFNGGTATLTLCTFSYNGVAVYSGLNSASGSGGGMFNSGTATLTDCIVSRNTGNGATVSGGGLTNDGTATLTGCTVFGNSADGFYSGFGGGLNNNGMATLTNCTVSGNAANSNNTDSRGGGVFNSGTATLTDCTVSNNAAKSNYAGAEGGGVFNSGTATLTNCTVSGNGASRGSFGSGGGVFNSGTATLTDCTVFGNSADGFYSGFGGGVFNSGTATLTNCTVSGNSASSYFGGSFGGGLSNLSGTLNIGNSIVAGNGALTSAPDVFGTFASQGNNLIGSTDGSSGWVGSDLTDASASPLNLGPLADNGGPTLTMALLSGSRAINAGSNALIAIDPATGQPYATDQRGSNRIVGGRVDIGAYESDFVLVNTTTTVSAANATYDGLAHGATAVVDPGSAAGAVTFLYTGTGATVYNSSVAPTNAGTYHVVATFTPTDASAFGPSSGSADFTIAKATLTGDATTQDALNMAKQGKLTITVSNVSGLVNGDTLATFLKTASYYITIGTTKYEFVPTTVTTSGSSITITYTLKNSALLAELGHALDAATSGATAVTAGFDMESASYTLFDTYLSRMFSTVK